MKNAIILFILAFLIWIGLNWSVDPGILVAGFCVAVIVALLTKGLFKEKIKVFARPKRYFWFLCYIPVFIWECVKANLDGAWRVVHPQLPINPGIVKVKTTLKSDAGITFLANSLTLKPGTMTVDIDKENGYLYIHWVDVKTQDIQKASELIVGRFERILKRIFV